MPHLVLGVSGGMIPVSFPASRPAATRQLKPASPSHSETSDLFNNCHHKSVCPVVSTTIYLMSFASDLIASSLTKLFSFWYFHLLIKSSCFGLRTLTKLYSFICGLLCVYLTTVCCSLYRVEGCLPVCPPHMVLDEVTRRCVYVEDCKYPLIEFSVVLILNWSINRTGCCVVLTFWLGITWGGTILRDGGNKKNSDNVVS